MAVRALTVAIVLASLATAGCGRVAPLGAFPEAKASAAPKKIALPEPEPPLAQPIPVGPAMNGAGPAAAPTDGQLVVGGVTKKKAGFLWRKLKVAGQITNRSGAALSGEVTVRFKKGGAVVQSEYVAIASLSPGQSQPFDLTSAVAADDVEVVARAL